MHILSLEFRGFTFYRVRVYALHIYICSQKLKRDIKFLLCERDVLELISPCSFFIIRFLLNNKSNASDHFIDDILQPNECWIEVHE